MHTRNDGRGSMGLHGACRQPQCELAYELAGAKLEHLVMPYQRF